MLNETRKDRYRSNADIGLIDLQSPSLDVAADDLAAVTIPALVLAGDTSHPSLRSVAHRLAGALPDARFVELDDCGHVTYVEQPAGGTVHVAGPSPNGGWRVIEVWDSAEEASRFLSEQFGPALKALGFTGRAPEPQFWPVHNYMT